MRVAALGLLLAFAVACQQDDSWQRSATGPLEEFVDPYAGVAQPLFMDDLVVSDGPDLPEPPEVAAGGAPRVLYLYYSDGTKAFGPPCSAKAPAFKCAFGGAEGVVGCEKKVQAYLDKMYADFNLIFVVEKPTSGVYQTAVITDAGGAFCGAPSSALGVASASCSLGASASSYTFGCTDARKCATTIAQEHAHTAGLMHTDSTKDIMTPSWPCTCPSFEDKTNNTIQGICGATQNSYALMKSRLGAWPGGDKPSPFGSSGTGGAGGGGAGGSGGAGGAGGTGGAGGAGGTGGAGGDGGAGGAGGEGGAGGSGTGGDSGGGEDDTAVGGGCVVAPGAATRALGLLGLVPVVLGRRRRR